MQLFINLYNYCELLTKDQLTINVPVFNDGYYEVLNFVLSNNSQTVQAVPPLSVTGVR